MLPNHNGGLKTFMKWLSVKNATICKRLIMARPCVTSLCLPSTALARPDMSEKTLNGQNLTLQFRPSDSNCYTIHNPFTSKRTL